MANAWQTYGKTVFSQRFDNGSTLTNERTDGLTHVSKTLREIVKFLNARVGLWISPISPIKLIFTIELKRPQTEKCNSRRGLTELRKEFS